MGGPPNRGIVPGPVAKHPGLRGGDGSRSVPLLAEEARGHRETWVVAEYLFPRTFMRPNLEPPRAGLYQGERKFPAIPLRLGGNAASLVVTGLPPGEDDVRLVLDWECGSQTDLDVRIHAVDAAARLAHLEIRGIAGDWQPFLAYLGENSD